uniref:DUF3135 domain-containing protein n=1 Tax=Ningiella ruwaisensis TaxID=2364274 RepID=UPI001445EEF6|nr:DUF3135 domain-containing protein [Ningiella ruwaisensis]
MSTNLDFDHLSELYKTDPQAFEQLRKREIEKLISKAPEKSQRRLRGLQFQIDAKRQINKDKPYRAYMEISKMMHESFNKLNHELNQFCGRRSYYRE